MLPKSSQNLNIVYYTDQILAKLIQADETLRFGIHKLIHFILNKEELPDLWKESIIVWIYKKGNKRLE
jgi:hypothetical protein